MPEHDLKLVCDALPCSDDGTVSTQASAILKAINGQEVQFDIGGGEQPTLYAPIIYQNGTIYKVSNNAANGAFTTDADITAYINGVEVPLNGTLDVSDTGKTLSANISKINFVSSESSLTIDVPDIYHGIYSTDDLTAENTTQYETGYFVLGQEGSGAQTFMYGDTYMMGKLRWSVDDGVTWNTPSYSGSGSVYYFVMLWPVLKDAVTGKFKLSQLNGAVRLKFLKPDLSYAKVNFITSGLDGNYNCQFFTRTTPGTHSNMDPVFYAGRSNSSNVSFNSINLPWTGASGSWINDYRIKCGDTMVRLRVFRADTKEQITSLSYDDFGNSSAIELIIAID